MIESHIELEPIWPAEHVRSVNVLEPARSMPKENEPAASEKRILARRERHRTMLGLSIFVIIAAFTLRRGNGEAVTLPFSSIELPTLCGSRALFNVECPGCGLTRSILALGSGNLQQSLKLHRLGWLMALAIVVQMPYRVYALQELKRKVVHRTWPALFGNFLIIALLVNWLMKMNGW